MSIQLPSTAPLRSPYHPSRASTPKGGFPPPAIKVEFVTTSQLAASESQGIEDAITESAPTRAQMADTYSTIVDSTTLDTNPDNYENGHNETPEPTSVAEDEILDPFDTAEGLLRLMAATYLAWGRGCVSIFHTRPKGCID